MNIKDEFDIYLIYDGANCSKYGFIPCSPKCKEALKLKKEYDKLLENYQSK